MSIVWDSRGQASLQETRRSPLVLAGAIATAGVLAMGLVSFKRGNTALSQKLMRTRVLVQGATVALMVGTSGVMALQHHKDAQEKKDTV